MKEIQRKSTLVRVSKGSNVERFHITSRRPNNPVGVELLSYVRGFFVPINWLRFWPREWKRPIDTSFGEEETTATEKNICGQLKWPPNRAWRGKIDQRDSIGTALFGCNYDIDDTPTVSRVFTDSFVHTAISRKVVGEKCVRDNPER